MWRLLAGLVIASAATLAPGCSDSNDDDIRANVTLLVNHEGALAVAAAEHLQRVGRRAIPTIEAALHTASPTGKKNLILALRKIGDEEAVPLLGHLAAFENNADVRREALWTLKQWAADACPGGGACRARADHARSAVRAVDEERGAQEQG